MDYAVTIYMTKGISSESSYPYITRDGIYISEGRELNRAAWSDCCPVQRLGPHTLLPAKAVGPAIPAARKSGWARIFDAEELHAKARALGHGYNLRRGDIQAISLVPRRALLALLPPWSLHRFLCV